MQKSVETSKKYYSRKAITIATFLGGPLAAGILLRRNYINNNKKEQGNIVLYLSILVTVIIGTTAFIATNEITDRFLNFAIPAAYTTAIFFLVDKLQGKELKAHKERNGHFYSRWRAAGTGLISLTIFILGIVGYMIAASDENLFLSEEKLQANLVIVDEKMQSFINMEAMALDVFKLPQNSPKERLLYELKDRGIYYWKENINLLNELSELDLPQNAYDYLNKLKNYCELRIKSYELIYKSVEEDSDQYNEQIQEHLIQIEEVLKELREGQNLNP